MGNCAVKVPGQLLVLLRTKLLNQKSLEGGFASVVLADEDVGPMRKHDRLQFCET